MIKFFRHKGLEKFFIYGTAAGIRTEHSKRLRTILARLSAAQCPSDMGLPGLRMHALKGELHGYYAVNVSGNWRVVFRFEGSNVIDVNYLDYH